MIIETFFDAEKNSGIEYKYEDQSSLSKWYDEVRNKKFSEFNVNDLCRSIRQNLYVKYLISYIIMMLEEDPFAGEIYDGELIAALNSLSSEIWKEHTAGKERIVAIINQNIDEMEEDIKKDANELLIKLR